ncbi:hypothetical protein RB614_31745 [Phytohabitans sp. ZYX-F-186]|uniref:MalT-like TPR region domain-containing protein n=1 Tax=Phytohabitans maris TaxID=3071409 RepID=A0ABU0ZPZ1_9ACTN|nr:hypothetical protein [Phytohabitans sp. ZYX-F-186]MDQ7909106.1 hypothetical protein [Phytohabitans sp. ZYX-F-186]
MRRRTQPCEAALNAAEDHFSQIHNTDGAAFLYSPTDLSRMAGSCYLFLDNAPKAAGYLTETLARTGVQTKAAAVAAANLALAHTRQGKIDEATASLHQAIDIIETTRGGAGLTVAFGAGKALAPWHHHTAVRQVHDRLLTLMTG